MLISSQIAQSQEDWSQSSLYKTQINTPLPVKPLEEQRSVALFLDVWIYE